MIRKLAVLMVAALVALVPAEVWGKKKNPEGRLVELSVERRFHGVVVNGPVSVVLVHDNARAGQIRYCTKADVDPLKVNVHNSTLTVAPDKKIVNGRELKITSDVTVYYGDPVTSLTVNGSGDIEIGKFKSDKPVGLTVNGSGDIDVKAVAAPALSATVNGSGDVEIKSLSAGEADLVVKGSGDIVASGGAGKLKLSVIGSGDIDAKKLKAGIIALELKGSGDIRCGSAADMSVSVGGSGDVRVYGVRPPRLTLSGNAGNVKFVEK